MYDLKHSFQNLARYNERVNREMYEIISMLTDKARKREVGSWFGSIHGILNHIIICDINWLKRYRALSPESAVLTDKCLDPPNLSWTHNLHDDFVSLRRDRTVVDERICAWFAEFPISRYDEEFQYSDSTGKLRQATAGAAFEFLFLHQTHHRGQVSQILDKIGLPNNFADNGAYLEGQGN
jgi:uncharacterized damage-inducible protein DinB